MADQPRRSPDEHRPDEDPDARSNVSHFLFPSGAPPVIDDSHPAGVQFPSTPEGQHQRIVLQEYLDHMRQQAQTQAQIDRIAALVARLEQLVPTTAEPVGEVPRHKSRSNPDWDTYAGFRRSLCQLEEQCREIYGHAAKWIVANAAGCNPVTITRHQRQFYLNPRQWPPSTWPEQEPPARQGFSTNRGLASCLAAGVFGFGLLDVMSDGRFDGVISMVRILGCHAVQAFT